MKLQQKSLQSWWVNTFQVWSFAQRGTHTPVYSPSPTLRKEAQETHWFSKVTLGGIMPPSVPGGMRTGGPVVYVSPGIKLYNRLKRRFSGKYHLILFRGPAFLHQHRHGSSLPPITPVPELFLGAAGTHVALTTCMHVKHLYTYNFKLCEIKICTFRISIKIH